MAGLRYEVSFEGAASPTLRAAFTDCHPDTRSGRTIVRCDQESLPDVISRIEDLGLHLVGIRLVVGHSATNRSRLTGAERPRNSPRITPIER